LGTYRHDGFTASMDTFKDKQGLDELYSKGKAPWEVWRKEVQPTEGVTGMWPPMAADGNHEEKHGVRYKSNGSPSPTRGRPVEAPARVGIGLTSPTPSLPSGTIG
jgi:hypothetical protein